MSALGDDFPGADMLSAEQVFLPEAKPKLTVLRGIANDYWHDARDFVERFDLLCEQVSTQSGRVKNYVDLRMACECGLKAHALLSGSDETVYKKVRGASHDLTKLAELCSSPLGVTFYSELASHVSAGGLRVDVRYSLEAYQSLFAWRFHAGSAGIDYSSTIGNTKWIKKIRDDVDVLISSVSKEFTGEIRDSIEEILDHEQALTTFMSGKGKGKS